MTDPIPAMPVGYLNFPLNASRQDVALHLAGLGWAVFPIDDPGLPHCAGLHRSEVQCPPDKRGKHPVVAFGAAATTAAPMIRTWWEQGPRNIGIHVGKSRLIVVDEDPEEGEQGPFVRWAADRGHTLQPTLIVGTGRVGGRHLYYRMPDGVDPATLSQRSLGPGIDTRLGNGYVVAPGSIHWTGAEYLPLVDWEPAEAPDWLLEALQRTPDPEPVEPSAAPVIALQAGQEQIRHYLDQTLQGIRADLLDAHGWPDQYRDPKGRGWEKLVADKAWRLAALAKASWCPFTEAEGARLLAECAPTSADFTRDQVGEKWRTQYPRATPAPAPTAREVEGLTFDRPPGLVTTPILADRPAPTDEQVWSGDPEPEPGEGEAAIDPAEFLRLRDIDIELRRLRARKEAQRLLDEEESGEITLTPPMRLDTFLARELPEIRHRIEGVWSVGGHILLAAQQKSGKSTLLANIIRSLVDGDKFLGRLEVEPVERVVLVDDELNDDMLQRWLADQGIQNTRKVEVVPLRGKTSTFNLLNASTRAKWAELIGPADVLMFDCLRPVLDALGLSEDKDAGRFLVQFDALLAEAGIGEAVMVHHMGHNGERSRGDSRIIDWADEVWRLVKEKDESTGESIEDGARYIKIYGRTEPGLPESRLAYDLPTRRLRIDGGSRTDSKRDELKLAVLNYVGAHPSCTQKDIEDGVRGRAATIRELLNELVDDEQVDRQQAGMKRTHRVIR